jgi:hypothetical protein
MFEGPEYESYIKLCRELRLERELQEGDWLVYETGPGDPLVTPEHWLSGDPVEACRLTPSDILWLPRLDQWLAMLEEAGLTEVTLRRNDVGYWALGENDVAHQWGSSPATDTPEEATACLWVAVTRPTTVP